MDARLSRLAILAAAASSLGASYRTANFVVEAPSASAAQQIGQAAEKYRQELAVEWLGKEMPNWSQACPITAQVGERLGAGGATSFVFEHGEVFSWRMNIQGSLTRILDSVLPHEITHTIFATHFRQPLPRWADEGACTTVEHSSERAKQQAMLVDFLRTGRGIAFSRMFAMREYPRDVMPLYSQGYSVARYLVSQGGKRKFLDYLADGMHDENWARATQQHYGINSLAALQNNWLDWVRKGSPILDAKQTEGSLVAVKSTGEAGRRARPEANLIHRGQSPDPAESKTDSQPAESSVYEVAAAPKDSTKSEATPRDAWHAPRPGPVAEPRGQDAREEKSTPKSQSQAQYQVPRSQPGQRSGQVILEWSRPNAAGSEAPDG
jgi:hypothetical protein